MYCPKCGTKCDDTFSFCYKCGFQLPVIEEAEAAASVQEQVIPLETPAEEPPVTEVSTEVPAVEPVSEVAPEEILPTMTETAVPPVIEESQPVPEPKKGRLRVPALVLGIMMLLGLVFYFLIPDLPQSSSPLEDTSGCFTVIDGVLFFDVERYTGGSELVIPETVNGQTVTAISTDCFYGCIGLTSVILPDTLTEIGNRAFSGCTDLRGIFIPEGVKHIGSSAFSGCASLEAIHLPGSIKTIAGQAFNRCPKLVHIFYDGTHEEWETLYRGTLPDNSWIYCQDGNFPNQQD